jgi:hypothetical protein
VPKEKRLKDTIEKFEDEHDVPNTAIFNEDGLLVACGFTDKSMDSEIVGYNGTKLFETAKTVIDGLFSKPRFKTDVQKYVQCNIPDLYAGLQNVLMEAKVEKEDGGVGDVMILVSPIEGVGFILMFIERKEYLALIKMNLPELKNKIRVILYD